MSTTAKRITIGGIEVAARWTFHGGVFSEDDDDVPRATWSGTIELDDHGEPSLARFTLSADPPYELAALRRFDLAAHVRNAVVEHLARAVRDDPTEHVSLEAFTPAGERRYARSLEVARQALGRRSPGVRLDDEFLRGVVELYDRDGIEAVIERTDVSERTARRWLATARERGMR